jgi:hypothetical protein
MFDVEREAYASTMSEYVGYAASVYEGKEWKLVITFPLAT